MSTTTKEGQELSVIEGQLNISELSANDAFILVSNEQERKEGDRIRFKAMRKSWYREGLPLSEQKGKWFGE